ncbi:membrane protein [alpha proteobacterium U9-1i]|nr:membrane protein [alpha proteobacterium U9-1i]
MRKYFAHALMALLALSMASPALADGTGTAGPNVAAPPVRAAPIAPQAQGASAPVGQTGQIALMNGAVVLNVPAGYRFYPTPVAEAYIARNNAARPDGAILGLLAPANARIDQGDDWATVVSYDAIGYVQPATASGLTDTNFEADVRTARQNQGRAFEGFAVPAAFETTAPSLSWAERSAAPGQGGRDFRHEQKMLGRNGVACLTSIGSADQMGAIAAAAPDMLGMVAFSEGNRHADFQPASDTVSSYSVPGLVTGVPQAQPQAALDTSGGQTAFGGLSGWFPWIAFGVIALAGGGYLLMRRRRDDNLIPED